MDEITETFLSACFEYFSTAYDTAFNKFIECLEQNCSAEETAEKTGLNLEFIKKIKNLINTGESTI